MKYTEINEEDIGLWYGDKLIRLLHTLDVNFHFTEIKSENDSVEIIHWNEFDSISNSIFLNRDSSHAKSKKTFSQNYEYMERVKEDENFLKIEYLKSLEEFFKINLNMDHFQSTKILHLPNKTPVLADIFKHYSKFQVFNKKISQALNFNLNIFDLCKFYAFIFIVYLILFYLNSNHRLLDFI